MVTIFLLPYKRNLYVVKSFVLRPLFTFIFSVKKLMQFLPFNNVNKANANYTQFWKLSCNSINTIRLGPHKSATVGFVCLCVS
jgi:hypothetical protein